MNALPLNTAVPTLMHIDLNSCFATAEQQANPFLRGKPLVVAAYETPAGCILSPSVEAKRYGIKVGMRVREARLLCRNVIVRTPDPPKYRDIHIKFCRLFSEYSPFVTPKSIDEAVIDFVGTPSFTRGLRVVAQELKMRMRREIGEWISCSIGIAANRFWAKLGASFHKPDGLSVVTHENVRSIYARIHLLDLHGINTRFQTRLNAYGIFTPSDFLAASLSCLQHQVFCSVTGYYWYLRLRGWEIDAIDFARRSFGQSYALGEKTDNNAILSALLLNLTEKMGRRLRRARFAARGMHIALQYADGTAWHQGKTFPAPLYTTSELYQHAMFIFNRQPVRKRVSLVAVSCFHLMLISGEQQELFVSVHSKKRDVSDAVDAVNDRFGEYTVIPAHMMRSGKRILDRISFGGVRDLESFPR